VKAEITARLTKVTLEFAGKRRSFQLCVDQLAELQEITGFGPSWIKARLETGQWHTKEISETIRLGMIGAGETPAEAEKLTERYVRKRPWEENRLIAWAIISACLVGVKDEAIKKAGGGRTAPQSRPSPTESSDLPTSTAPEAPWGSTSVN
jgi:Phage tail tube protein, GTA-gp10